MRTANAQLHSTAAADESYYQLQSAVTVERLTEAQRAEVLSFLAARPLHTVYLSGLIRDNGLESPLNRGSFYGCRNAAGHLEGVALLGHAILLEVQSEAALKALAQLAQGQTGTHLMLGEQAVIERFWHYYAEAGRELRLACREQLFELRWPVELQPAVPGLRLATLADLDLIVPVHAQLAFEESGVNPLAKDPIAFRQRCARRIEQGKTWVWVEAGRLLFKADIVRETPEVIYLEGIFVDPAHRGQGHGLRCLSQLSRTLLTRTTSICLLVNEQNQAAQQVYRKAGFKPRGLYATIFL